MSSFISILSFVGASLPFLLIGGLVWAASTVLDVDAEYMPRKRTVPVADDTSASPVSAPVSKSLSSAEKIKKTEVFSPVGEVQPAEAQLGVETYVKTTFYPPKPAPTSLAAKLKFDGLRCGSAPLAAFSRYLQPFKPTAPIPVPSAPSAPLQDAPSVEVVMTDVPPSPHTPLLQVDPMDLDQPSRVASPTSPSMTSTSPGILRKVSQMTKQFANLKIQPPPVDISSLIEMMARLSLNDNLEKAPISQPFPARSQQIHQAKPPSTSSFAPPQATSSFSSGQSSSVPAPAATVKTEKKVARAPSRPSTSATSEPPKSATPATPQRPAGQLSLPAVPAGRRPRPLFASARKALSQGTGSQSAASSSSGQPPSTKATAFPPTAEKKKPTPTASNSKPLPQSAAPQQSATRSSSSQPSEPAKASEVKKETPKLSKMGPIDPKLAAIFDQLEAEENDAKTEKPTPTPTPKHKPKPKLAPKPSPKPEPKHEPKPEPEADSLEDLTFEDLEAQLAVEELEMEKEKKSVPKYTGKDRKIAPLKRK